MRIVVEAGQSNLVLGLDTVVTCWMCMDMVLLGMNTVANPHTQLWFMLGIMRVYLELIQFDSLLDVLSLIPMYLNIIMQLFMQGPRLFGWFLVNFRDFLGNNPGDTGDSRAGPFG